MIALLEVFGVSVSFDGFCAVSNLSFSFGAAELRAVIGPNSAGKTTFMDNVTGKTKPDSGRNYLWQPPDFAVGDQRGPNRPRGHRSQV